ncbi:unnamed protein product [Bursaphelenchus xylophilus]|uniref:(pine wood nematode) hypothetical protein n=1 Tax=Bursaphelenchus xylophilus TaxID=6326 RepID=A0A1I7RJF1_BURXY|nr:unnamed protein product [Bursaphelenchus xylophilus]CAG9128840.1 unnamed protein product [Bursaphelenchus xylophilus]
MKRPTLTTRCLANFLEHNIAAISTTTALTSTEVVEKIFLLNNKSLSLLHAESDSLFLILQRTGTGIKLRNKWTVYIAYHKLQRFLLISQCPKVAIQFDTDGLGHIVFRKSTVMLARALKDNSFITRLDLNLLPTSIRTGKERCLVKQVLSEIIHKTREIRGFSMEFLPFLDFLSREGLVNLEYLDVRLSYCWKYLPPLLTIPINHLRIQGDFIKYLAYSEGHQLNPHLEKVEIDSTLEYIGMPDFINEFKRAMTSFAKEISSRERVFIIRGPNFYEYGPMTDLLDTVQINLYRANSLLEIATAIDVKIDSILIIGAASVQDIIISSWKKIVKDYISFNFLKVEMESKSEKEAYFTLISHTGTKIEFRINCTEIVEQED